MKQPPGFDDLIARVRAVAGALPDPRTGDNTQYSMADIALAAFSVFFTQCPSFLSFQQNLEQARGRNNARSLFQVERIPSDNHIRQMLDPVAPEHLMELFDDLHRAFDEHGLLPAMRAVQNTRLIALDATWYFSSQSKNIHCPNCSCLQHADGKVTHFHSAITPVIVSPGHAQGVPLRPEFIVPQDGHARQDCEIAAAKRWLTDAADALPVNWCDVTVTNDAGKILYHSSFITDWKITTDTVAGLVSAGRARWKIENENNNVLKTKGYPLEHNFGHGQEHFSSLLATLNLLAFALHTFLEVSDADYQLIRGKVGARRKFFQHIQALTTYLPFENWARLMDFMMSGLEIGPHAAQKS